MLIPRVANASNVKDTLTLIFFRKTHLTSTVPKSTRLANKRSRKMTRITSMELFTVTGYAIGYNVVLFHLGL